MAKQGVKELLTIGHQSLAELSGIRRFERALPGDAFNYHIIAHCHRRCAWRSYGPDLLCLWLQPSIWPWVMFPFSVPREGKTAGSMGTELQVRKYRKYYVVKDAFQFEQPMPSSDCRCPDQGLPAGGAIWWMSWCRFSNNFTKLYPHHAQATRTILKIY